MGLETVIFGGTLGPGFIHGFCDGMDIPISNIAETALTFAPALGLGAFAGYIASGNSHNKSERAVAIPFYSGIGAVAGGVLTLIGYGLGYATGHLTKA